MGQGSQALSDRPEAIETQGVHGQASERGHDLYAIALAVAVVVLPELGVAGPVPGFSIDQRSRTCCSSAVAVGRRLVTK